jgi:hypothetical protein
LRQDPRRAEKQAQENQERAGPAAAAEAAADGGVEEDLGCWLDAGKSAVRLKPGV